MKEKDIVNFDEMEIVDDDEHVDENGEQVGCHICYTHREAYKKLVPLQVATGFVKKRSLIPLCPRCGKPLSMGYGGYTEAVVSEVNYSLPDGEIGYYEIWHCEHCANDPKNKYPQAAYAMMPIPVSYNANHDIFYTGGRDYPESIELENLVDDIFKACVPSILQYVKRKLTPKDFGDENLDTNNVICWTKNDVTKVICNWLYEKGWKK